MCSFKGIILVNFIVVSFGMTVLILYLWKWVFSQSLQERVMLNNAWVSNVRTLRAALRWGHVICHEYRTSFPPPTRVLSLFYALRGTECIYFTALSQIYI